MGFAAFRSAIAATLLAICAAPQAATVASQAPDLISGTNMSFATVADSFNVSGGAYDITNLRFWSIQSTASDYSGSVYWAIHSDAAGAPGGVLFSSVAAVSAVNTGATTGFGYLEFVFDIPVSFSLAIGDYWLALHNGPLATTEALEMLWETSSAGDGAESQYVDLTIPGAPWLGTGSEQAFLISGNSVVDPPSVPEPAPLALLLAGVLAAGILRRPSRRSAL